MNGIQWFLEFSSLIMDLIAGTFHLAVLVALGLIDCAFKRKKEECKALVFGLMSLVGSAADVAVDTGSSMELTDEVGEEVEGDED